MSKIVLPLIVQVTKPATAITAKVTSTTCVQVAAVDDNAVTALTGAGAADATSLHVALDETAVEIEVEVVEFMAKEVAFAVIAKTDIELRTDIERTWALSPATIALLYNTTPCLCFEHFTFMLMLVRIDS